MQVVSKWRELAEQSKWDEFVAAMLQEHYDVVYARAQLKYLTPSSIQHEDAEAVNGSLHVQADEGQHQGRSHQGNGVSNHEHTAGNEHQSPNSSLENSQDSAEQQLAHGSGDETVEAAGALSHLFGGPRQKLMQQMNSKQAESTLRWHREPVAGISHEIYTALALKLLTEYDPAATRAS